MSSKKISEFPELEAIDVTNDDVMPIVNEATNKKFSWANIKTALGSIFLQKSSNLSDVGNTATARNNILPSKTGNALKVLRVNSGETDYELAAPTATVDWGGIGGTLSDQTDLLSALDAKVTVNVGNAGTATTLETARLIDGVSFDGSANIVTNHTASIYNSLGSAAKGFHWSGVPPFSNAALNASNSVLYLQAMWVPKDCTITGVQWIQFIAGNYTANNYNGVGLYSYSGGTLTLVASSTNDGNIWKGTANTLLSKAFSATYNAAAGLYFVGALWCRSAQTTAPAIMRPSPTTPNNAVLSLDFTNSAKLSGTVGSITSLPSSQAMSGVTVSNLNVPWLQLY